MALRDTVGAAPSLSCAVWSIATTRAFCSRTSVNLTLRSVPIDSRVISTSTVSLGLTKPATPETSSIRTEAARMPSGSKAEMEAFWPSPVRSAASKGWLIAIGRSATRSLPPGISSATLR